MATAVKTAVQIVKPTYAYGWDKELRQAWRAAFDKNGKLQQKKEFVEVTPLPQSKGTDAPVAVFSDGDTHTMDELTVEGLMSMGCRGGRKESGAEFVGITNDGFYVKIVKKPDRYPLMCILLAGKQICQVRIDMFPEEAASKDFMRGLAIDFLKGKFEKPDIYKQRDLKLENMGLQQLISVHRMRKRPATIMSSGSTAVREPPPEEEESKTSPHTTEEEDDRESNSCEINSKSDVDDVDPEEPDAEVGNAEEPAGFDPPGESMLEISGRLFG